MNKSKTIKNNDIPTYEPLYQEVMRQCIAIQEVLGKHDLLFDETPFEEWKELRQRFWNQYVYLKFVKVYFELFPDERVNRDDPDSKRNIDILKYNQKMAVALCEWLKRDGFFHFFEGEVFFINPDPTDMTFILTDGVPFKRYPPQYIGTFT